MIKKAMIIITTLVLISTVFAGMTIGRSTETTTKIKDLSTGWEFFSLPFEDNILKEDLIIKVNGDSYTFSEAVNEHIIEKTMFTFNKITQRWDFVQDVLYPGEAYILFVYGTTGKSDMELHVNGIHRDGGPILTELRERWNYFGITVSSPIPKENLIVTILPAFLKEIKMSYNDAVSEGVIDKNIFNAKTGSFVNILEPGEVYILFSYTDHVTLSI